MIFFWCPLLVKCTGTQIYKVICYCRELNISFPVVTVRVLCQCINYLKLSLTVLKVLIGCVMVFHLGA